MEKTLRIDGKNVRFKATAATLLRYKAQTGSEFLGDCALLAKSVGKDGKVKSPSNLNVDLAYGLAWAMAKTADKDIPDMLEWLDEFEEFDLNVVFSELFPMLNKFLRVDPKNASAEAEATGTP